VSTEKITNPQRMLHWPGHMETDYIYTLGVAGERFFKELKKGRIMGAKCKRCGIVYVPVRLYCERCFEKLEDWVDVGTKGKVYTFTVATVGLDGARLEKPVVYAFVKFDGAEGGLIHRVDEVKPENVSIGMSVKAVFKPPKQRTANINDIQHFKPQK